MCFCCGEDRFEFLAFDHEGGRGNAHRRELRIESKRIAIKIRLACHNCNSAIGFYGYCPHEIEKETTNGGVRGRDGPG